MPSSNFACFFDIDGVIAQGPTLIEAAKPALRILEELQVPVVFLSNTCFFETKKAKILSANLGLEINPEHVVLAQTPMRVLSEYHNQHVLISGQGPMEEIARQIGFQSVTTVEKVCKAFPELDMVNHNNRSMLNQLMEQENYVRPENFRPIEAIVLLGEPIQWESSLQVITDLLLTDGNPGNVNKIFDPSRPHIPVIACNRDLVFKSAADLPRFGHGAFLTCLEALYQKLSGAELQYTAFVGKPFEISYQYSELIANKIAASRGQPAIDKIYFVGDNPDVDIVGANMYNHFLQQDPSSRKSLSGYKIIGDGTSSTAKTCEPILVCTGVYNPQKDSLDGTSAWRQPATIQQNILDAVKYILDQENITTI